MPHRNLGGRPPKFNEPSRPVTLTLPESTLKQLESIDSDRAQAIVKLTHTAFPEPNQSQPVEIVNVDRQSGLLIVGSNATLKAIPFLKLIEVALGRFLIAIDQGHDFRSLELALRDLIEEAQVPPQDLPTIESLLETIRTVRRTEQASPATILFVPTNLKTS
jgi:hypothetical protein